MSALPQEIIDQITDHLRDDHDSLRTCSISSRAFVNTCQQYLFETITIDNEMKASRLLSILRVNQIKGGNLNKVPAFLNLFGEAFKDSQHLPSLLPLLTSISHVSLHGLTEPVNGLLKWPDIPENVRNALKELVSREQVAFLELHHISFPKRSLVGRKSIAALLISIVMLVEEERQESSDPVARGTINAEALTFDIRYTDWTGSTRGAGSAYAPKIITAAKSTVKFLTINWKNYMPGVLSLRKRFSVLADCDRLEAVLISKGDGVRYFDNIKADLPKMAQFLELISRRAPLHFLQIQITVPHKGHDPESRGWRELDAALVPFAERGVKINLCLDVVHEITTDRLPEDAGVEVYQSAISDRLPRTRETDTSALIIEIRILEVR